MLPFAAKGLGRWNPACFVRDRGISSLEPGLLRLLVGGSGDRQGGASFSERRIRAMTSDRHPDHGTEDSPESEPGWLEDSHAGIPSESSAGEGEGEGEAGTEFAKAPSAAPPDPEPSTSFDSSSFRSSAPSTYTAPAHQSAPNMLPGRARRASGLERLVVRVIATGGVVGIGVAIAAILAASKVQGWIIGLVVAIVSVVLSAVLWSSRQL